LQKKNNLFPYIFQKKFSFLFETLADWEYFFLREKKNIQKPIFISGLPRSGTTLITSIINQHIKVGSYNYKDLPFHRIPITWNKINKFYYSKVKDKKRFHGDQLNVGLDSPDAFEELIWSRYILDYHKFGFSKYLNEEYKNLKLENDLIQNIQKILYLRNADRYLSKGNYNIFRLKYIKKIFNNAKFIICFRNPYDTVQSLVSINHKFNELEYGIKNFSEHLYELCHFEFGKKRHPLFFNENNFQKIINAWEKNDNFTGYLLQWIELYEFVLKNYLEDSNIKIFLLNFDKLIKQKDEGINKILKFCELEEISEKFQNKIKFNKTSNYNYKEVPEYKSKIDNVYQKLLKIESEQ
jgi:hypothetical protein